MARIELENVSLTFHVRQMQKIGLKEFLLRRMFRQSVNPILEVSALKDINFRVEEGDRLGIVGHNGAGKSTLLRLLAGIYPPTSGRLTVEGKVSALFDIALGFEADASGWENIAIRGYLQGESPESIRAKRHEIGEFTELGDFLHTPIRHYSSGMRVRLAFAIATAIDPEVLLVDEVLAVGDMSFQEKAQQRMKEMMSKARLIVMVSHNLPTIYQLCNRAVWLDHGQVHMVGQTAEVLAAYSKTMMQRRQAKRKLRLSDIVPPAEEPERFAAAAGDTAPAAALDVPPDPGPPQAA
jgi:ABC-type polysaccharide/polyol phosphate transport system ATPase subunit